MCDHAISCMHQKKLNNRTDLCKRAYLSLVQLPWWGCAPHFVATNWRCTAKVLQNIQNAIPRRHAYYKMTDTAAQKTPWSACWTFLTYRVVTRNRTFLTSTKPKNCVFFFFWHLVVNFEEPFGREVSSLKKWKAGSVQCACGAGLWWFVFEWLWYLDFDGFWISWIWGVKKLNTFNLIGSGLSIFRPLQSG